MNITSTTDTPEAVTQALGNVKPKDPVVEAPAEAKEASKTVEVSEASKDASKSDSPPDTEGEHESESESDQASPDRPKKKGGWQRRIDKLTAKNAALEQSENFWREEALKAKAVDAQRSETQKPEVKTDGNKPSADKFDTHEAYVEALADWKYEQRSAAEKQASRERELKAEQAKRSSSFIEKVKSFTAEHPDYSELMEDINHIPMSLTVQEVLLDHDNGAEFAYELAKHPDEYERICKMSAVSAARELGKFEAKYLSSAAESKTETKTETKTTKAPKPIAPVGTSSSGSQTKDPGEMSYQEFKKYREAQIKEARASRR
jgi:hypothetical protein